jgi:hypothetical protein
MELHMHSHHYERRIPDWRAAVIAGVIAGAIFLLLEVVMALVMGKSPWLALSMMAGIVMGPGVATATAGLSAGLLAVALGVHFLLSIVFGLLLAASLAPFNLDSSLGMASLAGLVFGLALYAFDFHVMTMTFPWFAEARGPATLVTHLLFGLVAAGSYCLLKRADKSP